MNGKVTSQPNTTSPNNNNRVVKMALQHRPAIARNPHPLTLLARADKSLSDIQSVINEGNTPALSEIEYCQKLLLELKEKLEPVLPEMWPRGKAAGRATA